MEKFEKKGVKSQIGEKNDEFRIVKMLRMFIQTHFFFLSLVSTHFVYLKGAYLSDSWHSAPLW